MIGSLGTLGILTQLTLKVRPLPEMSAFAVCELSDSDLAEKLLANFPPVRCGRSPSSLTAGPLRRENPVLGPLPEANALRLHVGFEGAADEVQWMLDALRENWRAAGVGNVNTVVNAPARQLLAWLTDFPAEMQINVRPSSVCKTISKLLALDPHCSMEVHAGNGVLLVSRGAGAGRGTRVKTTPLCISCKKSFGRWSNPLAANWSCSGSRRRNGYRGWNVLGAARRRI